MSTTKRVKRIRKKEFVATTLDHEDETVLIHITSTVNSSLDPIYSSYQGQIIVIKADKASTVISFKYSNFANIVPPDLVVEFS